MKIGMKITRAPFSSLQKRCAQKNPHFISFLSFPPLSTLHLFLRNSSSSVSPMAMAGDPRAPYESGGAGEKFCERPFRSDEDWNSAATGKSELEQMLKQVTVPRSKMEHPAATMENLPDEILSNIFIRLLAKQLGQMRSVSKSWNAFLSHPSFVKSHLHRSIRNDNQQIFLAFPNYHELFTQYSSQSLHFEPTNFIKHTPADLPMEMEVIGSVHGLICVSKDVYSDIRIWNPSLSAMSSIPPPHSLTYGFLYLHRIRFGFDPKTDDYKLVKLTGLLDIPNDYTAVKEWLQIEVYSMRKRSWDLITQPFPSHVTRILNADFLCVDGHDGHLHWEIETVVTEEAILAFDLHSETFREIPLPDSILDSDHRVHRLGVLGGKLCEMAWRDDGSWKVWVMEDYGVPESWVIRHVFSQFKYVVCLYGFTSRNELLLIDKDYKDYRLVLYDPVANKTKSTHTEERAMNIVGYVDSLVWF